MSYAPEHKLDYVSEGLSRLLWQYRGKPVIEAILTSYLNRLQELEDAIWEVIEYRLLDKADGEQLNAWGRFVNLFRLGRDDDTFRRAIKIEFLVLRSDGFANTMAKIASLVYSRNIEVEIKPIGLFEIRVLDMPPSYSILGGLRSLIRAKTAGVRLHVTWSTHPKEHTFTFRDDGPSVVTKGWGDKVPDPDTGGYWSAMLGSEAMP